MSSDQNGHTERNIGRQDSPPARWQAADHDFMEESSSKAYFRIPSQRKFRIAAFLDVVLFILCLILIYLCIRFYNKGKQLEPINSNELCKSPQCIRTASSLLWSMNTSVNPCDDFYEYTCGRWYESHPIPYNDDGNSWAQELMTEIMHSKIEGFLKKNNSIMDPNPTVLARLAYDACVDTETLKELQFGPLKKVLSKMNLQFVPQLTKSDYDKTQGHLNMNSLLAIVKTTMNKDLVLSGDVAPDPHNTKRNLITIGASRPNQAFYRNGIFKNYFRKENSLTDSEDESNHTSFIGHERYLFNDLIKYFMKLENITDIEAEVVDNASDKFYSLLNEIRLAAEINVEEEDPKKMSISELQAITDKAAKDFNLNPKINWTQLLKSIFAITELKIDWQNEKVAVNHIEYLKEISVILSNHTDFEFELYVWYEVIHALIPYLPDELTNGQTTGLVGANAPREKTCAKFVSEKMNLAIAVGLFQDVDVKAVKADINKMIDNIQFSMKKFMNEADWLDKETKSQIIEKANFIHRLVGYPDWLTNKTALQNYYKGVVITDSTHLMNYISLSQREVLASLETLSKENNFGQLDFDPVMINAAYLGPANLIAIPFAILNFPYYGLGLDSLNYGAIGMIIGHELTHAFDTNGRKFDKYGNTRDWWTNKTLENYMERTKCFTEQYSKYSLVDTKNVDGERTLSENIADNGGLKDAFHAYQKLKEDKNYKEYKLPGLEHFSGDQLFYLSFAHTWCEVTSRKALEDYLTDEHSPRFIRVLATLANSHEFAKTWSCPKDSVMNPSKKCELW